MEDESRGMSQTCTARSNERSLRSGRLHVVKLCEFSSKILFPHATRRGEPQCRGPDKGFLKKGSACGVKEQNWRIFVGSEQGGGGKVGGWEERRRERRGRRKGV